MKHPKIKLHIKSCIVLLAVCIGLSFLSACSSGPDSFDKPDEVFSDTGSLSFSLQWEHQAPASAFRARSPSGNVCVDYGIETISVDIYSNPNTKIASGSWSCSAGQGIVSNVPPGTNMRIMIEGIVSGEACWCGEKTGISVFAGQTTEVGIVAMNYICKDHTPPPAPIDLTVDTDTWADINFFHIDWTNPNDQSGITGAYYTLGSAPVSQTDANYTTAKPFTVSATVEGGENIYIWLMDMAGNTDPNNYSLATLFYDATAPIDGNISVIEGDRQISLSWFGFSDTASGINQYVLSYSTSGFPSSCDDPNTIIHFDPNTHYLHTNLENGTTYYYRICAMDNSDLISNGVTASGTPQIPPPTEYYVDANKGSNTTGDGTQVNPWMTISYALSQVPGPGMTIHVAAGTYDTDMYGTWPEVFPIHLKDGVSLKGENRDTTIIDAEKSNILITGTGIGSNTSVEGFTFKNGKHNQSSDSGGITLSNASPKIKNNIFENNEGWAEGGAISTFGDSSPSILSNIFRNNINEYKGGTIYIESGSPIIGENLFTGNSAGITLVDATIYIDSGTALIRNNLFINNNTYGGITIGGGSNTCIMNNTIIGTDYNSSGSGIIISGGTGAKILNNIIAENTGYGIEEKDASYDPNRVGYNLFYNNNSGHYLDEGIDTYTIVLPMDAMIPESSNNLEANPLFIDQANDDYHLQSGSPAINTGTNDNAPDTDMDGDVRPQDGFVDIGADESELTPPENIIAFPGDGRLTITWDAVSAATQYNIYMAEFSGVSRSNYSEKKTVSTEYYTWTGLTNGTTCYFVLTSENSYRESSESNEVATTPNAQTNYYISPDSGIDSSPTHVTIIGEGFQETPTVALYGGGPYIKGSCDTPGYNASGVYVAGTYAYVADGSSGLQLIDVSDPANLGIVGTCDTPDYPVDVFVSNPYTYVADGSSGLQVIDVSDPNNLTIVGTCDTPNYACGIFISGSYAYVVDQVSGLQVIDINDPANPSIVGSCDTPDQANSVFVSGSYAYVADYDSGLQVIDINDPANPSIVGSCDTPGQANSVFVLGSYAYVADQVSGLQVIDINDPANPSIIGSCDTPDQANSVFVSGSYAYVADYDSGLQVIDISDPNNPTIVVTCDTPNYAGDVFVSDSYAYVADQGSGLQVIDISYLANPGIVGTCDTPNYAGDVFVSGSYAYVVDQGSGLQVIDVSDPNNPTIVGTCDTSNDASEVFVSGSYAYVVNTSETPSGLQVIDINNPNNPSIVGSCDTQNYACGIFISGSYAYVVNTSETPSGLQVIDINNPNNPTIVGTCDTPDYAVDVFVSGSYAYVAVFASGLQVIDISNPNNPTIVGSCDTQDLALDVFVSDSYAYVAVYASGLQVIEISDPANPTIVGFCDTPGTAYDVHVAGSYAYVADGFSGLQVIDISDPYNPIIVSFCDTPHSACDVFISGSYAYVADEDSGLQVVEKFEPLPDITYIDSYIITATIPSGFSPGTYNLNIINPDGVHTVNHNAFTVYHLP